LPGYASTLLIGVLDLLRTRCEADTACCQNNRCWQLHRTQWFQAQKPAPTV